MLPHLRGRPVAIERYPRGLAGEGFFQKNAGSHYPDWIRREQVPKRDGGTLDHVVVDEPATIVYLDEVAAPARLKTSGSAGFHVHVPLDATAAWEEAGDLARRLATTLADRHPDELTVSHRKADRHGRVFVDWLRNGYGQTSAAAYSVRARAGAPVATPIEWDELDDVEPRSYTVRNLFRRLGQRDDPWAATLAPVAADTLRGCLDALDASPEQPPSSPADTSWDGAQVPSPAAP